MKFKRATSGPITGMGGQRTRYPEWRLLPKWDWHRLLGHRWGLSVLPWPGPIPGVVGPVKFIAYKTDAQMAQYFLQVECDPTYRKHSEDATSSMLDLGASMGMPPIARQGRGGMKPKM